MSYLCYRFTLVPRDPWADVLASELGEAGFSMFEDTDEGILAYAAKEDFDKTAFEQVGVLSNPLVECQYTVEEIEKQNWNEEWEKNFDPVEIPGFLRISAPFHPVKEGFTHQISIMPKMAFGTGHHATTYSVCQLMQSQNFQNKKVLDMGCGTGILGFLAYKMGAEELVGIDIDDWATENCIENAASNQVSMEVLTGGAELLENYPQAYFDVVIANINRNILLRDLPQYVRVLKREGQLYLSGFYQKEDAPILQKACNDLGMEFVTYQEKDLWTAQLYRKL